MIRAVIDTNVLISGLLVPRGNEALILLAAHQGLVRPWFSAAIMQEYEGVLARPSLPATSVTSPMRPMGRLAWSMPASYSIGLRRRYDSARRRCRRPHSTLKKAAW